MVFEGSVGIYMDEEQKADLILHIWVRLDEIKSLLLAVGQGLEEEAELNVGAMHGIISIIRRELEGLLGEIDRAV